MAAKPCSISYSSPPGRGGAATATSPCSQKDGNGDDSFDHLKENSLFTFSTEPTQKWISRQAALATKVAQDLILNQNKRKRSNLQLTPLPGSKQKEPQAEAATMDKPGGSDPGEGTGDRGGEMEQEEPEEAQEEEMEKEDRDNTGSE